MINRLSENRDSLTGSNHGGVGIKMVKTILLTILKIFLLVVVAGMVRFQLPELRYDFTTGSPVRVESVDELSAACPGRSTFASVRGKGDLSKAATFVKYGVRYTYFLLEGYGNKIVVRTPEGVNEQWSAIDYHIGRLGPYDRMPFSRSVRAGFRSLFDVGIADDALFLARDDAPQPNGWSIGAVIFACLLWCVLAYFFFVHSRIFPGRKKIL